MPKRSAAEHTNYDTPVWSIIVAGVFDCATCAKSQQRPLVGLASASREHFPAMQPPAPLPLGGSVLSGVAGPVRDIPGDLRTIGRAENWNFSGLNHRKTAVYTNGYRFCTSNSSNLLKISKTGFLRVPSFRSLLFFMPSLPPLYRLSRSAFGGYSVSFPPLLPGSRC